MHYTAGYLLVSELEHVKGEEAFLCDKLVQGRQAAVGRPDLLVAAEVGARILDPGGQRSITLSSSLASRALASTCRSSTDILSFSRDQVMWGPVR